MITIASCSNGVFPRSIHQLVSEVGERVQKLDAAPANRRCSYVHPEHSTPSGPRPQLTAERAPTRCTDSKNSTMRLTEAVQKKIKTQTSVTMTRRFSGRQTETKRVTPCDSVSVLGDAKPGDSSSFKERSPTAGGLRAHTAF